MEYKFRCNTCGNIFCFTDEDMEKSRKAGGLSALSAIGTIAGAMSGNWMAARVNQADMHDHERKVMDFNHCPNCHSTDFIQITDKELEDLRAQETSATVKSSISINSNASVDSLIKRIEIFIDEDEWEKAGAYCEQALDMDPENGLLYYYELLVSQKAYDEKSLAETSNFADNKNFRLARKYGDADIQSKLDKSEQLFKNACEERVEARRSKEYEELINRVNHSSSIDELEDILSQLQKLHPYKDTEKFIQDCQTTLAERKETENQEKYNKALSIIDNESSSLNELQEALSVLNEIRSWKDVEEDVEKCIERQKTEREKQEKQEKKGKKRIWLLLIALLFILALIFVSIQITKRINREKLFNQALEHTANGEYELAYSELKSVSDYIDTTKQMEDLYNASFAEGAKLFDNGDYDKAKSCFFIGFIETSSLKDEVRPYRDYYLLLEKLDSINAGKGNYTIPEIMNPLKDFIDEGFGNSSELYKEYPIITQLHNLDGYWVGHLSFEIENGKCHWNAKDCDLRIFIIGGKITIIGPDSYLGSKDWEKYEDSRIVIDEISSDGSYFTYNGGEKYYKQ